jgi:N-acetylneuraminate lyase
MGEFFGIVPAVVTPLDEDGKLLRGSMERLLEHFYTLGCNGVYVCGQTGEGLQLPTAVRKDALEVCVRNTPTHGKVIAHVGAASTAEALELARHAKASGAHAISSLPPAGGYRFDELKSYYEALAAVGLPTLVYYFPAYSSAIQNLEQILDLCTIENVVGLKFTDFDLYWLSLVAREGLTIFNGRDEVLAAGLLMGAHGGIGSFYNLLPGKFVAVQRAATEGNWTEARRLQDEINDVIREVLRFPMIAAIKEILTWSGIPSGMPVGPRRGLTPDEASALRRVCEARGMLV